MCGIVGFIGSSTNPDVSNYIITALFNLSDSRGADASGFWAVGDCIHFYKNAIPSSSMILNHQWQQSCELNPHILLGHARAATHGDPKDNRNNQPFVSINKEICVIHNGRITDYDKLKDKYVLESECDSEILLRIFEANNQIEDILDLDGPSAIAVAMNKNLWLYRNAGRPLWLIDVRQALGQIFFCSTIDMWVQARFNNLSEIIYPLGENELWFLSLGENIVVKRFNIEYN